jgi:hypothetical protein
VADKLALRRLFSSEYLGFPCQFSFYRLLHTYQLESVSPHPKELKKIVMFDDREEDDGSTDSETEQANKNLLEADDDDHHHLPQSALQYLYSLYCAIKSSSNKQTPITLLHFGKA